MSISIVGSPPSSGDAPPGPRLAPLPPGPGRCAKTLLDKTVAPKKSADKKRYLATRKSMANSTRSAGNLNTAVSYTAVFVPRHARHATRNDPLRPATAREKGAHCAFLL